MQTWTIKTLLDWSTGYFSGKGVESARLDAELLLAPVLKLKRLDLYLQFDRPLTSVELSDYKALIRRRLANEPVASITGKKEFWSRDFFVTLDVLIPRPDTEVLVDVVLKEVVGRWSLVVGEDKSKRDIEGFEMGLGSGNIAITLLLEFPELKMTAIEISPQAIAVAKKNAVFHGVADRLQIIQADFLANNPRLTTHDHFDFIVSNPPYVPDSEILTLPLTIQKYEPHQALAGGQTGLFFYPAIAAFAKKHLKENGLVAVEIGESQAESIKKIFAEAGFSQVKIRKDYAGKDRVISAKK